MSTPLRTIQPSGTRSTVGKVFEAGDLHAVSCRADVNADDPRGDYAVNDRQARPHSLYIARNGTGNNGPGSAAVILVQLTLGEGEGGALQIRQFHVGSRGTWLSVAGWRYVKLEILAIDADDTLGYTWNTEPAPFPGSVAPAFFYEILPAATASRVVPPGMVAVSASAAAAGAFWRSILGASTFTIAANITAGGRSQVLGGQLMFAAPLAAPLTLAWELGPI